MASKSVYSIVAVLGIAAASGAAWWYQNKAAPSSQQSSVQTAAGKPAGAPPVVVTLVTVIKQDVPVSVEVNGNISSLNSVDVRSQLSNVIKQVHIKEGQFVRAGDVLFTLDDRTDRANVDKASAQQMRDQATLADLERQYKRSLELVQQNFISKSAADTTLSQVEAQRALLASDVAAIQSAKVALTLNTLKSPINGRVGSINVFAGSLAQPSTALVTVTQLDPIAVTFPVPESSLQDVLAAVKDHAPVSAMVQGSKTAMTGAFSFVDNTVDASLGTLRAKAVFSNKAQQLWPGQFVTVKATLRTLKDATVIPLAAVITNTTGQVVYVVSGDTKEKIAQLRKIKVLQIIGDRAAVSGVEADESIVLDGKQNLRPGGRVRLEAPAGAGKKDLSEKGAEANTKGTEAKDAKEAKRPDAATQVKP